MTKRAIHCPKLLGGCGALCVEVGHALGYPKKRTLPGGSGAAANGKRGGHLYRYCCPECGREWIHDTLLSQIYRTSQRDPLCIRIENGDEVISVRGTPGAALPEAPDAPNPEPGSKLTEWKRVKAQKTVASPDAEPPPGQENIDQSKAEADTPSGTEMQIYTEAGFRAALDKVMKLAGLIAREDSDIYNDLQSTLQAMHRYLAVDRRRKE